MAKLDIVPEGLENHHQKILDMYDIYLDLTDLVIHPNGSLKTFAEKFSDLDSEFMDLYKKVERLNFTEIE